MQLEGDDGKTLACFVPSEAGKVSGSCHLSALSYHKNYLLAQNFVFELQNHSKNDILKFSVKLDGTFVGAVVYQLQAKGTRVGIRVSPTMRQPYQLSQLATTGEGSSSKSRAGGLIVCSDADDALHAPVNADLGTIRVKVK